MNDQTDSQLLRAYADHRSEPAFAEIVRRHVDFIHSAALRMVCDSHLAEDVTQGVFVALAKNAAQLTDCAVLSGWLHRTAQNIAAQTVRTDVRRRAREQEAAAMNALLATEPDALWANIAPQLDAALGELSEPDRDALLLRYFERKSAREMAQTLGTSEDAAQKRVSRAIERLREFFAKRGVTVSASGLVVAISANAVQAAPVGLAVTISTAAALAGTTIATTATATTIKTIAMTTLQKTLVTATLAVAVGGGIYETRQVVQLREKIQTFQRKQESLADQLQQLQQERDDATNRLANLLADNSLLKSNPNQNELLKLRGEVSVLKNAANDSTATAAKDWLARVGQLKQRLAQTPDSNIPELQLLSEEDWLAAVKDRNLNSDSEYRRALSTLRYAGENKFASKVQSALQKYYQANDKQFPTDFSQLQPYFDSPVDEAIIQRWEITSAKTVPNLGFGPVIITQKAAVDDLFDQRIAVGQNGMGSTDFLSSEYRNALQSVYKDFSAANNGQDPTDISQLLPYATTPEQKTAIQKWMQRNLLNK